MPTDLSELGQEAITAVSTGVANGAPSSNATGPVKR